MSRPGTLKRVMTALRGGDEEKPERTIHINAPDRNGQQKYLHNRISTAKYNLATFFPKFFYEQFSRYANLFFLFTGVIQLIDDLSPTSKYGTIFPLSVVLLLSAIKEIVEDRKRHAQDAETNSREVKVLDINSRSFELKKWRDVCVGDTVRIEGGEAFPADLILLSSSEPDALCYIETSNLDGETNLKIRQGRAETADILTPDAVASLQGIIKSEQPNNSLYTYEGTLQVNGNTIPLDPSQLLLRGAMLKNTRWVYAIVVFTGHESKLMRNATAAPIKTTKVERMVNTQIIFLFCILLCLSLICSIGYLTRQRTAAFEVYFVGLDPSQAWTQFGKNILTYIILFNNLIPLSLIVTMEAVKFSLGGLINTDLDMYDEPSDTPAVARTSSLVEELGQVDYVFSDKTGTLTQNIMEFRMAVIGGIAYSDNVPEDKKPRTDESGAEVGWHEFSRLMENKKSHTTAPLIREFTTLLGVCHTVIPERDEENNDVVTYQASSPDEAALVKGVQQLGVYFHTRRPKNVTIRVDGVDKEYEVLNVCEFNSTRKRMSCLVRDPEGQIKLYIKGADTVILERLAMHNPHKDSTVYYLEEYATEGLRTLCIAYRDVPEDEYQEWAKIYERASTTINNRQEELDKAAELIEKDLTLLGATAIEDKLQDGVPDTIATLMQAGIKVWVLTGDRQETAINIGFSCRLITGDMTLIVVNEATHFETKELLEKKLISVKGGMGMGTPDQKKGSWFTKFGGDGGSKWWPFGKGKKGFDKDIEMDSIEPMALIIDGRTLDFALEDDIKLTFLELATHCKAVVCCRVSPLQKALVVKLVRKNVHDSVTLAIGDGANDVGMIQAAHVGVGISGQEGLQAARSADFAIAQFRFLRKLLLVHGGWAYARMSKLICYSFYKNITLYLIQMWFAINNAWSAQTLFETWSSVSSYNVAWSVFQPFVMGIFDQYVSARMLDRYPQLYHLGQRSVFYNHKVLFSWVLNSFYHSLFIYYAWHFVYGEGLFMPDGRAGDNWSWGQMVYASVLATIGWKAALVVDTWVKFTYIAIIGSFAAFMILFPPYTIVGPITKISPELFNILRPMFASPSFWFGLVLIPIAANLRDFVWKYVKRTYFPKSYHIIQEVQKYNIPDYRPRMEWFRKAVHKVRMIQRLKRSRGFAFSQTETGQVGLISKYDTTQRKPQG